MNQCKEIHIKNIPLFKKYLSSILKLIPSSKFIFNGKGTIVSGINESGTIRIFVSTNSAFSESSDEKVEFSILEIQKLLKCVEAIEDTGNQSAVLIFDGSFIKFDSNIKFKLRTAKEEAIEKYIIGSLKVELNDDFGFSITNEKIKKLINLSFINSSENPKIYFSKNEDHIFAEVDNKKEVLSDSIGIPISDDFFGGWEDLICVKVDGFRFWNLLNSEKIDIAMTDKKVAKIKNIFKKDQYFINAKIISQILKS